MAFYCTRLGTFRASCTVSISFLKTHFFLYPLRDAFSPLFPISNYRQIKYFNYLLKFPLAHLTINHLCVETYRLKYFLILRFSYKRSLWIVSTCCVMKCDILLVLSSCFLLTPSGLSCTLHNYFPADWCQTELIYTKKVPQKDKG